MVVALTGAEIAHMKAVNNCLWVVGKHNAIYKMKVGEAPEEIKDSKLENKTVTRIYVDPSGQHCLLAAVPRSNANLNEIYYLNRKNVKVTKLNLQNALARSRIEAITTLYPNQRTKEKNVLEILVGTREGALLHSCIEYVNGSIDEIEPFTQIYQIQPKEPVKALTVCARAHPAVGRVSEWQEDHWRRHKQHHASVPRRRRVCAPHLRQLRPRQAQGHAHHDGRGQVRAPRRP